MEMGRVAALASYRDMELNGIVIVIVTCLLQVCSAQQTQTQTAVAGVSTNINIPCSLGREEEAPFWYINYTVYELFSIPSSFPYIPVVDSYTQLTIPEVAEELNNTLFRCGHIDDSGDVVFGVPQRLLVVPNTNPIITLVAHLQINYQDFDVEQNVTTLGWNFTSESNCGDDVIFLLQGYTLRSLVDRMSLDLPSPIINRTIHGSLTAQIPSEELTTGNDSIVYRVVALDRDGIICSDPTSQQLFYKFDESDRLETRITPPNADICFDIPTRSECTAPILVWPRDPGSDRLDSCACHLNSNHGNQSIFNNCYCFNATSPLDPTTVMFNFSANGSICIIDEGMDLSETIVNFQCSSSCGLGGCFLKTIQQLHRIVIPGTIEQTVVEGDSANIICDVSQQYIPDWYINGSLYISYLIPSAFSISIMATNEQLSIQEVPANMDNTSFQCVVDDGTSLLRGITTILRVLPGNSSALMETSDLLQCVGCQLMFYQDLNIGMNSVSTGWCLSNSTECSTVVLQGVNASSLMLHFNETLPIPGQEKVNISTQQPLAFRLVAVDENGTICSNQNTHFYRFDMSEESDTHLFPNTTTCYPIPSGTGRRIRLIFPHMNLTESCVCPIVANRSNSESHLMSCDCIMNNCTNIEFKFSSDKKNICIANDVHVNSSLNHSLILFEEEHQPQCRNQPEICYVHNILSTYRIIIPGPPGTPNITYNASEGALCLSAYSHTEFPVLNFTVTVTDNTGIESPLSGTYVNTGKGPLCLNVTSDPVPNVCHPFQVSVTAWNAIGSSPSVNVDMFTQEDPNRSEAERLQDRCACYQEREQTTNISITRITDTAAVFTLMCGLNLADPLEYRLLSTHIQLMLECGIGLRVTTLMPDVNYTLFRVYSDLVCKVDSFTTEDPPPIITSGPATPMMTTPGPTISPDSSIVIIVVAAVVAVAVLAVLVVIIVVIVMHLRRRKHKKTEFWTNSTVQRSIDLSDTKPDEDL